MGSATARPNDAAPAAEVSLRLRHNDLLVQSLQAGDDPAATRALGTRLAAAAGAAPVVYDRRLGAYRTVAASYRQIREGLEADRYRVETEFDPTPPLPFVPRLDVALRPYQQEALDAWRAAGGRGVVVLPTGAGKTLVALAAVAHAGTTTLAIVPTLDLLAQWHQALIRQLAVPAEHVGIYGGGKREIAPITVMTYDSAAIHARELNAFGLIVFDEVHHLPASTYRLAAQGAVAPFRLGLSATPERSDGLDADLAQLVGPVVYCRTPRELKSHLARYREQRIAIALSPEERAAYDTALSRYREYVRRHRLRITSPEDFQRLIIWPSASNAAARDAMLAHREARRLAFNAGAKLKTVVDLLAQHRGDRIIIFTEFNSVVDDVSRTLLVPSITHKTPAAERAAVLDGFRSGRFSVLVTGRVLNEGVDVPDANVAIVLSGTATRREYVQRLGRILRPKAGPATLYELVTEESSEEHVTRRRHGGAKV